MTMAARDHEWRPPSDGIDGVGFGGWVLAKDTLKLVAVACSGAFEHVHAPLR